MTLSRTAKKRWFGIILIFPALLLVFAIIMYPLYIIIQGSFYKGTILKLSYDTSPTLENYMTFFAEGNFIRPLVVTLLFIIAVTSITFLVGFVTAIVLNQKFKGRRIARVLTLLPWPVPSSIASLVWIVMLNPTIGIINYLLIQIGILDSPITWLSSEIPAFLAVTLATSWKGYPFFTLILLSGMQSIPLQLYEAAKLDGANWWGRLIHVTLPSLRPVIAIGIIMRILWLLKDFSIIYIMTGGGPRGATETLALHLYKNAFEYFKMNYASAVGVVILVLGGIMTFLVLRMRKYQGDQSEK